MNLGSSNVSNRKANAESSDAEALERENDRELEELSSKASYLRQITIGMRDDVESQNLILNNVDNDMSSVRTGLSSVVGRFKQVLETRHGKKNLIIIGAAALTVLFLMYYITR